MTQDKKLIFLDIDGTLTEPGSNIPPQSAITAIRGAQQKGHKVFLCTGRNYDMLAPLIPYGFDGIVGSSGCYVEVDGQVIYDCPLKDEERDRILAVMHRNHIFCTVESRDGSYTDEGLKEFLAAHANEGSNSELLRWRKQLEGNLNIRPMSEYRGDAAYKIIFMCLGEENLAEPLALLKDDFALTLQEPDRFGMINGEIVCKGQDKGTAIRKVADYLKLPMEATVGYGDSMNDKEMLEVVGHSVCMENGSQALKDIVKEICPPVGEDGLCRSFREHGWS